MLSISAPQMQALRSDSRGRFVSEMVEHSRGWAPRLCGTISEPQLRLAVQQIIEAGCRHDLTHRGPLRLCVETMFVFGSGFDSDPQCPQLGQILRDAGPQSERAEALYERVVEYLEEVSGEQASNVHVAMRNLLTFAQSPIRFADSQFAGGMVWAMGTIFPQKAAYVGEANLHRLVEEARSIADQHGFVDIRAKALLAALMFAFGHGCTEDPLYPWIAATLADDRIVDPAARAQHLERKTMTWLEHVLADHHAGNPT